MAAPTGTRSGVGFRNCVLFALNAAGLPNATGAAAAVYEGVRITGNKSLTINDPEPRRIFHTGDDSILSVDVLPPNEAMTGELHLGKKSDALDALITGQLAFTVGEAKMFGIGTDKRGDEAQVGLLAYRQAQDTDPESSTFGMRTWDFMIMPKVQLVSRESGFGDQPEDKVYTVIPAKVNTHLWGTAFALGTEGFLTGQIVRGVSWKKPKLVAWKGDGNVTALNFPVEAQAVNTDKISVWVNGVLATTGVTKAVSGLTFATAPATTDLVVAFYETD